MAIARWPAEGSRETSAPIMSFERFLAPAARFGRIEPSRHNLSAPDLVFDGFTLPPKR